MRAANRSDRNTMLRSPGIHPGGRQSGFSLLELILLVAVLGVAAAWLLDRAAYYQSVTEKARFDYTVNMLRSALRIRIADLIVRGRAQDIKTLANQNPMLWLETLPPDYRGEFDSGQMAALEDGKWYFDRSSGTLVYTAASARNKVMPVESENAVQVRVAVRATPTSPNAGEPSASVAADSVMLRVLATTPVD